MSLRNRARHLQRVTRLTYQQALERLRALGDAPARLAREKGWPITQCDAHLVAERRGPVLHAAEELRAARTLTDVCLWLLASANARAVLVVHREGRLLASAGEEASRAVRFRRSLRAVRTSSPLTVESRVYAEAALDGAEVHSTDLGLAHLYVVWDARTSLGIVRLRTLMAVAEIGRRRLLEDPVFLPPGAGGEPGAGGSGAPAQISAFDGLRGRGGKIGQA
ncbi:MAG TPA: hypothetical protein VIF09_18690 [Polyangiaceae bacterium]|jgi:hypothetical protein